MSSKLEQQVRTVAGWIGVEISKSRVRTPGKAGFGLYRVRSAAERHWHVPHPKIGPDGPWTPYAFGLGVIKAAVRNSIGQGTPAGPMDLHLVEDASAVKTGANGYAGMHVVPTRWTPAYRGRRDLGVSEPVAVKREFADEATALAALVDAGLVEMEHVEGCACEGTSRITAACVIKTMPVRPSLDDNLGKARGCTHPLLDPCPYGVSMGEHPHEPTGCDRRGEPHLGPCMTAKQRQREHNAEFQAEHLRRREYGLVQRYAAKRRRNSISADPSEG